MEIEVPVEVDKSPETGRSASSVRVSSSYLEKASAAYLPESMSGPFPILALREKMIALWG